MAAKHKGARGQDSCGTAVSFRLLSGLCSTDQLTYIWTISDRAKLVTNFRHRQAHSQRLAVNFLHGLPVNFGEPPSPRAGAGSEEPQGTETDVSISSSMCRTCTGSR